MDWMKDVEIEDLLSGDLLLVYEWCGREMLLDLWEHFPRMTLYISTKPINEAKKRYIKKHFNGKNVKELCALLQVSERFVYEAVENTGMQEAPPTGVQGQGGLF